MEKIAIHPKGNISWEDGCAGLELKGNLGAGGTNLEAIMENNS